jgi:type IV secretory pathway ATPase VirB11/archaellum biosynthesis ATPase
MTVKDRLRMVVEDLSDDEAAAALAYIEERHGGGRRPDAAQRQRALARLQAEWAKVPAEVSLVDELLAERREEARRDTEA